MKTLVTLILVTGLSFIPILSLSQDQLKIGHADINEIMNSLPERDSVQIVLEKETKEIESTYEELTVAYNKLLDEYQNGLPTFSELIKKTKEAELLDKQKRISEFQQNASITLQRRNAELIQPIYDKIIKAIEKVAAENGFTYILDLSNGSVVYTSKESQNINQQVLKILKP
jgi:outer membrane protein